MSHVIDEHRQYLADPVRVDAFRRALAVQVRPGDVVLDLGSGTGILGLLACQAGAARVYAVDEGGIVGLARDIARANAFADRIQVIRQVSTWTRLPEPVDLIVTDQIGHLGFDAGVVEYVADARARLLAPGGRLVPAAIDLLAAPCEHPQVRDAVDFWRHPVAGLDFSAVRRLAACSGQPVQIEEPHLLAPAARIGGFDLAAAAGEPVEGAATFTIARAGRLDGLGGWFVAHLAPGVTMSNGPGQPARIARRQAVLPLEEPVAVEPGDHVRAALRIRPVQNIVDWQIEVIRADGSAGPRARHSTFEGMLVSAEDVQRTHPAQVPELSEAGAARRSVLELCDGRRTVGEIERAVQDRHAAFLPTRERAAAFVAEVLTRYAR